MTIPEHLEHFRIDHPVEHTCEDCGERSVITPEQIDAFLEAGVFCCAVCEQHELPMATLGAIHAASEPLEGVCANCAAIVRSQGCG